MLSLRKKNGGAGVSKEKEREREEEGRTTSTVAALAALGSLLLLAVCEEEGGGKRQYDWKRGEESATVWVARERRKPETRLEERTSTLAAVGGTGTV